MYNFSDFYEEYYTVVYKYFRKKIGENDAEDLTQQTFVKLLSWIGCIDKIHSPKALIFKVAYSVLCDYLRNKKLFEAAISFNELYNVSDNIDFSCDIEINSIIDNLPERDKKIVQMKVAGYKSNEIGKSLGISGSTVRTYLEKIKKILK